MKNIIIILSSLILFSCTNTNKWEVLFDGEKVNGLRGYRQSGFPSNDWTIVDGTLKTIPGHGVDLISENVYKDFELELEWKVTTGGNSGIFYFATEEGNYIWQSAPEMQVLDNDVHTDGKNTLTSAGALYAMIAPSKIVVKPVGGRVVPGTTRTVKSTDNHWKSSMDIRSNQASSYPNDFGAPLGWLWEALAAPMWKLYAHLALRWPSSV